MGLIDQGIKGFENTVLKELINRAESGELGSDINKVSNRISTFFKEDLKEVITELKKKEVREKIKDSIIEDLKEEVDDKINDLEENYNEFAELCKDGCTELKKYLRK